MLSIKNNNPGNLRPVGGSGFRAFDTPEDGLKAMYDDLLAKVGGNSAAMASRYGEGYTPTLESLLSVYAPPSENDTGNYIQFVADKTGLDPRKPLTPEDIDTFMPAMVEMEGGEEAVNHFYPQNDFSSMSDEELAQIAGVNLGGEDYSSMTDEELAQIAGVSLGDKYGKLGSAAMGAADSASYGLQDEATGAFAGLTSAMAGILGNEDKMAQIMGSDNPSEVYNAGLEYARNEQDRARADNPGSYIAGQVAGAIAPAIPVAKGLSSVAKLQKYARTNPFKTAAATGAVSGGVYGFNSGEGSLGERAKTGLASGSVGAAAGPVGARIGQSVGGLFDRAQKVFGNKQLAKTAARQVIPEEQAAKMRTGEVLPMTQGQATQDPSRQALENAALRSAYGPGAQETMLSARAGQQKAIRETMESMGSGSDDSLVGAANQVRSAYRAQKARVGNAYDSARNINQVYVNKAPISEQFVPRFKETLNRFNLDERDLSPAGKQLFQDLSGLKSDKITAVNLAKMEKWRGKASNIIANNNAMKGNAAEGAAFRQIVDDYDKFMAKLPEDALKSGDDGALQAILKARGERRAQGVLFERDKTVRDIVQSQDLTDEELANMILTGSRRSEKINSQSGRLVKNLKRAVGDNAPKLQEGIKSGTLARMLQRSTGTQVDGNTTTRIIEPAKLRREFDALVKNRTFLKEVFSPEEIKTIDAIHRDLIKIASEQPGTNNYSNTAYTLMRFANLTPIGKTVIGDAMQTWGDKLAEKNIKKGLSPVLDTMIDQITANKRFYGAVAGGVAGQSLTKQPTLKDAQGNTYYEDGTGIDAQGNQFIMQE